MLTRNKEKRFKGLGISGGAAVAGVCLFRETRHDAVPAYSVTGDGVVREKERLEKATRAASERLSALAAKAAGRLGAAESNIFVAQRMMIEDPALQAQMLADIEHLGSNAETVVATSFDAYESILSEVGDENLKQRASDIAETKRRLLDELRGTVPGFQCANEPNCQRGKHRVVCAQELTPTLTMDLDPEYTLAFVTEHGGAGSHAAILARALGIPAVSGIKDIHSLLTCGTQVLVDGDRGEIIVWPQEETLRRYPAIGRAAPAQAAAVDPVPGLKVLANISRVGDVREALNARAEGIGLYRTEFEFLAADRILDEEEQLEQYAEVVRAMAGRPVTFRLLDLGGDKSAAFLDLPAEENPYLGLRGSRLLLRRPDLFEPQARALALASQFGPVNVLYPMIVEVDQFKALREAFDRATADIPGSDIRHGVMFEVPSLCLQAREVFEVADFGSIGTNDLIQYLFAVDRNNELVAYDYDPDRPALWALIRLIAEAATEAGRPLSVCGEMAGNPAYVARLTALGIDTVSVSPRLIPVVRSSYLSVVASLGSPVYS